MKGKVKNEIKEKEYRLYGFNITFQSATKKSDLGYYQAIEKIYSDNIQIDLGGDTAMFLRTGWAQKKYFKDKRYWIFYGKLTKYTTINGKHWLNTKKKEFQDVSLPENVHPNIYETDFYFFPAAHRFFVRVDPRISPKAVLKFLINSLKKLESKDDIFKVNIISSTDSLEKIMFASQINRLKIKINYTNDDLGTKASEIMDKMLKDGKIGELECDFKPDNNGAINSKSTILNGLLQLSKENGQADATIKNSDGKRERIITSKHPEKHIIKAEKSSEESLVNNLFDFVMKKWRSNNA